jgi:hypothetical protein
MKFLYLSLTFLLIAGSAHSQQFEIGPTAGYWFNNIVDNNSDNDRAVIGNALWRANYGLSAMYYIKGPKSEVATGRIGVLYRTSKIGSVSESNSADYFEAKINTFGLLGGLARDVGNGYIVYLDVGFSYNTIQNDAFYKGSNPQTQSFKDLSENLMIKSNLVSFLYAIGVEKNIVPDKLKLSLELNGDAGISRINQGNGSYGAQSVGFGVGLRYIIFSAVKKDQ